MIEADSLWNQRARAGLAKLAGKSGTAAWALWKQEMNWLMIRALIIGVAILLVANGTWFVSLYVGKFSESLVLLLWCSPAIAALISASLAPCKKILVGTSMAAPTAILAGVLNSVYEALGHAVDFPGYRGSMILVAITLTWGAILCTLGGVAGYFLTRKSVVRVK